MDGVMFEDMINRERERGKGRRGDWEIGVGKRCMRNIAGNLGKETMEVGERRHLKR